MTIQPSASRIAGFTRRGRSDWERGSARASIRATRRPPPSRPSPSRPAYWPTSRRRTMQTILTPSPSPTRPGAWSNCATAGSIRPNWLSGWTSLCRAIRDTRARDAEAAKALKARTLTNLYNIRPRWLADAHATLDPAAAAAYGWDAGIAIDDTPGKFPARNLSSQDC